MKPKLRFPEFKDTPEWVEDKIEHFLKESRVRGSTGDVAKKLTVKLWGKGVFEKDDSLKGSANTQYYRRKSGQFIYSKLDFLNQAFGIIPEYLDGFESTVDLPCFDLNESINPVFFLEYVKREDFYKKLGEIADEGTSKTIDNIKISRGEENIFIWCIFLAICELAIDGHGSYSWVKNFYIDDPISSLDDNNAIAVASDLAKLLKKGMGKIKGVISSHHGLFFNVMWNEFKSSKAKFKTHFLYRPVASSVYTLRSCDETPFFHHVAMLSELKKAVDNNVLYTHHFNVLRSILEKTATFFGFKDFSDCIHGVEDEALFARTLNLLSHGKYSVYEPREMGEDNKELFKRIFTAFLDNYKFVLPDLTLSHTKAIRKP